MEQTQTSDKPSQGRKKKSPAPAAGKNDSLVLTPDEMAIFQRVKNESREWETITEESIDDYSLREDPFKLPDIIKAYQDRREFAFRWIARTTERLDEVRSASVPNKWWIVNAESFPDMIKELDPILGCVCKLDQMLVFKPWWMHAKRMEMVQEITAAQDRAGTLEAKNGISTDQAYFTAGKRSGDDPRQRSEEIRGGDIVEYEEPSSMAESQGVDDLITNE